MMIVDDDILFFSVNSDFIQPEFLSSDPGGDASLAAARNGRGDSTDRLPNQIGGYKVGELLGKGGFGEVRVGDHQLTGERVALKFLRKAEIHSLGAAARTNTEIQCLATLKHMNIIRLQQVGSLFL
jgi:serine/threonine protein kinase